MKQLVLDLGTTWPYSFDNFVAGKNIELVQLLRQLADPQHRTRRPGESQVYLWGPAASGKTHLLRALAEMPGAYFLNRKSLAAAFRYNPAQSLYLLDDCDRLSNRIQVNAFNLFNQVRENGAIMVASGSLPPTQLALREDLRTRLGWGLIYQLYGLSDDEKMAALAHTAQMKGLTLSPGVLPYLMTHWPRDMGSLSTMFEALDRYSLQTKRPITVPLLLELMQQEKTG